MKHVHHLCWRLALISSLLFCITPSVFAQDISVQLNGRGLKFDQPPAMIGGRLLVPLRGIFEALSADVLYDAATRSIKATKGTTVVQLQLGSRTALIDGRTVYLDVPADTVGGRTMVPLRFVSESLGAAVKWSGATKTVVIDSLEGNPSGTSATPSGSTSSSQNSAKPRIDQVVHNATTVLKPGKQIEVVVYGDPGAAASFEILGKTQEYNLPEVSPGRYQTRWTVPNGLQVEDGVLLAHLKKNGAESVKEADRKISVGTTSSNSNPTNPSSSWQTSPADRSTVSTSRPPIAVTFPSPIYNGTARLYVDGVDFSQQASFSGNRLSWQPDFDLTTGQHTIQVRASSTSGPQLDHQWTFQVNLTTATPLNFTELRPAEGQQVTTLRPVIGAFFNQAVSQVTLTVDNTDVTNQVGISRQSNGITWTPTYNLGVGAHRATVTATDAANRRVSKLWSFTVTNANTGVVPPQGNGLLSVTNLTNNMAIPAVFNVSGSAQPGRQVTVIVEYTPNNLLEILTGQSRQINQSALVSQNGRFNIQMNTSEVRSGQNVRITVSDGGYSPSLTYSARRQ